MIFTAERLLAILFMILVLAFLEIHSAPPKYSEDSSEDKVFGIKSTVSPVCDNCVSSSSSSKEFYKTHLKLKSKQYAFSHLFEIFNIKKYFHHAKDKATSAVYCLSCRFAVSLLDQYLKSGASENEIGKIAKTVCTTFRIESPRVCSGLSELFKKEVTAVLTQVAFTPKEICGLMIGNTCGDDINPLHNWTIPLTPFPKPPVEPIPTPKPGAPTLRVLHLSDTHLDPYYKEGSLANCKEPLCCREATGKPTNPSDAAGYWGDYRNCDTPLRTLESMLDHISKNHKIDYVIWTGDIPPHDIWNNTRKEALYLIRETSRLMEKYLGHIPIFPALGNHESSPVNSFPIPQIKGNDSIQWLYEELARTWGPWFDVDVTQTLKMGAFYSVQVYPGFRIISINMNYCNNMNWWLLINSTDPAGELQWLVNELQLAEIKGEKVHIIGHIPPGNFDCLRVWSHNYYDILKRYESTVTAQFFGHTHTDEFEIFYDSHEYTPESRAFGIAYIGPSITTYNALNPGYRIYTIDGNYKFSSRVVLDHETYYMNLTDANRINKPHWQFEYSARQDLKMPSLLPKDWDDLTKRLETDDSLLQLFYRFYVKHSDYRSKPCDEDCKTGLLCYLRKGCSDHNFCPPVQ